MKKNKQKNYTEKIKVTGAEAVALSLIGEGIKHAFGYPGGAIMPIHDSLYKHKKSIDHLVVRHEQAAVHAAQGYARSTGKVAAVFVTSGPGATNLITGLADAFADSTPLVCITGQVTEALLGSDAFQEVDIISISASVTKWNYQVTKAREVPEIVAKAFYIAGSGRPGPVLIDITKNAQLSELDFNYVKCKGISGYTPYPVPDKNHIEKAAALVNSAFKPMVLIGQGILLGKAEGELLKFINKTGMPVASTLLGLSAIPTNHPQFVGMLGMHGNYSPNIKTNECDLLIAIGMRFDDRVIGDPMRYGINATVIHIDIDQSEIGKNIRAHIPLTGNTKDVLSWLNKLVIKRDHQEWLLEFANCFEKEYREVISNDINSSSSEINMGEVMDTINKNSSGNEIFVIDVGQHQMISARYLKLSVPRSFITSGGLGTMGFSLPAAIGAKTGSKDKSVIAIMGDGGFQMNIQELGTIAQSGLPIKIIILNNSYLGMVRQWQEMFFDKRYAFTEMKNPDFVKIAEGYGIQGKRLTEKTDLDGSIKILLDSKAPFLLEIAVQKLGNVFPMVPAGASVDQVILKPADNKNI